MDTVPDDKYADGTWSRLRSDIAYQLEGRGVSQETINIILRLLDDYGSPPTKKNGGRVNP